MARRKRQELIDSFSTIIGENNSDEAISFLEDLSDSVDDDLQGKYDSLKADYDGLDASWRARYIERFKNIGPEPDTSDVIETVQPAADVSIEDAAEDTEVKIEDIEI